MEFEIVIAKLWIKLCSLLIMDIIYWWNLSKNSERKKMALLQLALVVRAVLVKQGKVLILVSMYLLFWFGCGLLKKGVCCCLGFSLNFFSLFRGSWSLTEKVASVFGCTVISMENYCDGVDEGNVLDSIDFGTLIKNLEVCNCLYFVLLCLKCWSDLFLITTVYAFIGFQGW